MAVISFTLNGEKVTLSQSLRRIKQRFSLNNEDIAKECFMSVATINNVINENNFMRARTVSRLKTYVCKKLSNQKLEQMDTQTPRRTRIVKYATNEQMKELKEKILYLRSSGLSTKEVAKALSVSITSISRVLSLVTDFSENTYSLMTSSYYLYVKNLDKKDVPTKKKLISIEEIRPVLKHLLITKNKADLSKELGMDISMVYKISKGQTKVPRFETLEKFRNSKLILSCLNLDNNVGMPKYQIEEEKPKVEEKQEIVFDNVNPKILIQGVKTRLLKQLDELNNLEAMVDNTPEALKSEIYPRVVSRVYTIVPVEKV